MPIDRSKYPKDWEKISLAIREKSNWTCQVCGKPCRKPGVVWTDFVMELLNAGGLHDWYGLTCDEDENGEPIERPQRFTLTVAHLDHNPQNSADENLKAMCAPCHLEYDQEQHRISASGAKYRKAEDVGQLSLWMT